MLLGEKSFDSADSLALLSHTAVHIDSDEFHRGYKASREEKQSYFFLNITPGTVLSEGLDHLQVSISQSDITMKHGNHFLNQNILSNLGHNS